MATLSNIGVPGVGNGILHPKLKHHFRVKFYKSGTTEVLSDIDFENYGDVLTQQATYVSSIIQDKSVESVERSNALGLSDQSVTIMFDDDRVNKTCESLQRLFNLKSFDVCIEYLDGNESVIRTHLLSSCNVDSIMHSDLDYAGRPEETVTFSVPRYFTEHPDPKLEGLLEILSSSKISIAKSAYRSVLTKMVTIKFETLAIK